MPERFVSELAAHMRAGGSRVGVAQVLTAHRALATVPPRAARSALRAVLCGSRRDLEVFDAAWSKMHARGEGDVPDDDVLHPARDLLAPDLQAAASTAGAPALERSLPAAWSAAELLLQKDFADYTEAERRAARALIARLARRGPQRLSRRTRPSRRRTGAHDLRASVRASLRHRGELIDWRWRAPVPRPRPMVLIVDVSGSMSPYARMLLQYVQGAVQARRRVEAFAFGTRLTRVTALLRCRDVDRALARTASAVVDLGGGTRIGDALGALNRDHGRRIGRGSVVVVLSDGWDRGDPAVLSTEIARLSRTAHRLVWLNPLAADPDFAPLTRGMQSALPHIDVLLAGNSIASLAALADLMESLP